MPIVVSIATVPLYLKIVGAERFGLLSILWLLIGYFGLLDFGLSRATIYKMSQATGAQKIVIFWASVWGSLCLGLIGAAIVALFAVPAYVVAGTIPDQLVVELRPALIWIGIATGLLSLSGVLTGALESEGRFIQVNVAQSLGVVATQALPLAAALWLGPELNVVVPAVVLGRIATTIALFILVVRRFHISRIQTPQVAAVWSVFAFGGWIGISSLISPIMSSVDQFLIGTKLGLQAIPVYSIPYSLASRLNIIPGALVRSLFPRMSKVYGEPGASFGRDFVPPLAAAMTIICAPGILIFPGFLEVWIGQHLTAEAAVVGQILILGMWFNAMAYLPMMQLQAIGRPDLPAKFHLIELIPYLGILLLGLAFFGATGAAGAWSIRVFVDCTLLYTARRYRLAALFEISPLLVLLVAAMTLSQFRTGLLFDVLAATVFGLASLAWIFLRLPVLGMLASARTANRRLK